MRTLLVAPPPLPRKRTRILTSVFNIYVYVQAELIRSMLYVMKIID